MLQNETIVFDKVTVLETEPQEIESESWVLVDEELKQKRAFFEDEVKPAICTAKNILEDKAVICNIVFPQTVPIEINQINLQRLRLEITKYLYIPLIEIKQDGLLIRKRVIKNLSTKAQSCKKYVFVSFTFWHFIKTVLK